ncbi:hypothetical protein BDQ12DRAFT_651034 [Crucibulum laeve]|uniref:Uncharacterized protein n=1 Tax=Crucibulum laeve TaxID=68775 RepID=A0A5C3M034_9AGAR|nr:hypothetical protein BDQ12DRAFT_651034 [Crucibulum laeve]
MTSRSLTVLTVLLVLASSTSAGKLDIRATPQTSAVCDSTFSWTYNSKGQTPCLLAAEVLGSCAGGNWIVPALNSTNKYDNPNSTTANLCSCSWAAYNLLSACSACQNFSQAIQNWSFYIQDCNGKTTNSYFPSSIRLPDDTLIPFWAATNPTQWQDQHFDVNAAKQIADEQKPDLSNTSISPSDKSSKPIGAIVGGVVGGIAVLALAVGITLWMMCRRRKAARQNGGPVVIERPSHRRSVSDLSSKAGVHLGLGHGYAHLLPSSSSFVTSPTPTSLMRTHNPSVHSLSYFGSAGSMYTSASPPPRTMTSPSPTMEHVNRENVITPFSIPAMPPVHTSSSSRKGMDGTHPIYDSPTAPPVVRPDAQIADASPSRTRVNPPAYTPSVTDNTSSHRPRRSPHTKQGSADTQHSLTSNQSGETWATSNAHGGGAGSISAIDDVVSQMGITMSPGGVTSRSGGNTVATGQSNQVSPTRNRDEKRRPSPNSNADDERRDIA